MLWWIAANMSWRLLCASLNYCRAAAGGLGEIPPGE